MIIIFIIFLLSLSLLSISFLLSGNNVTIPAQQQLKTTKYRNMIIDLGDCVKTNARLNIPAIGDGPFPAVLLALVDMNETAGYVKLICIIYLINKN
ncbi:MAG TPA: hypothetical protein VFK40_04055 [Nitrososphaeraceae archaeon]|nr:hypothetical protein [Nitrososphaeraceae archaeon]